VPCGQGPHDKGFGSPFPSRLLFPSRGDRYPPSGPGMFGVFLTLFRGKIHNTGIIVNILTLLLCHLLTPCRTIDVGWRLGEQVSHSVLEGKPNVNHIRARIRNSHTQRLHNWTSSHNAQIIAEISITLLHHDAQDIHIVINLNINQSA
jgi:hypothetical protein